MIGFFALSMDVILENNELGYVAISITRQFESAVDFSMQVTSGTYVCIYTCKYAYKYMYV